MSMSRIAIHMRPIRPRVMFLATSANTAMKPKVNRYFAAGAAAGPVTRKPNTSRGGTVIWPVAL